MSSTDYVKRTAYKPIDFFFRAVVDVSGKKTAFVDAFQILNDRYLGRMNVCNYFYIAENSVRINELNIIALDELKNYHLVMRQNFYIPENLIYSLPVTTRFLESDRDFEVLLATLTENGYKKKSLIITFSATTLAHLDEEGRKRYARLRRLGYKICVSGFGEEFNSLDIFAGYTFEYLRAEADYFDSSAGKKKLLNMLVKFCASNKIKLVMEGADTPTQMKRFKREGVKLVTGKAASKLSRWVTNEFLGLPALTPEQREAYEKKLNKDVEAALKKDAAAFEELRVRAAERAKEELASGKVMPSAPRPELIKSPYQIRLEQQKQAAKRAALKQLEAQAEKKETKKRIGSEYNEKKLMDEASLHMFEGGIQSALAISFAADEAKRGIGKNKQDNQEKSDKPENVNTAQSDTEAQAQAAENKSNAEAKAAENKAAGAKKKTKNVTADFDKERKLIGEIRSDSLFGALGMEGGFGAFGVKLRFPNKEKQGDDGDIFREAEDLGVARAAEPDELSGEYNEKGQWTDDEGRVYDGYFDENGDRTEYQQFDASREGSYNDEGQWVDADGNVYDGYFDEQGRWIDYSFVNAAGEKIDNGYYDHALGKWVPFGYFAENGEFVRFRTLDAPN